MSIESVRSVTNNGYNQQKSGNVIGSTSSQSTGARSQNVKVQDFSLKNEDAKAVNNVKPEVTNEQIKKAVSDLNRKMSSTSCQFGINDATNRVTIKIIDNETKDVIKEYPAEETLEMIEKAWELAGIMVDEKL